MNDEFFLSMRTDDWFVLSKIKEKGGHIIIILLIYHFHLSPVILCMKEKLYWNKLLVSIYFKCDKILCDPNYRSSWHYDPIASLTPGTITPKTLTHVGINPLTCKHANRNRHNKGPIILRPDVETRAMHSFLFWCRFISGYFDLWVIPRDIKPCWSWKS